MLHKATKTNDVIEVEEDSQGEGSRGDGGHSAEAIGGIASMAIKGY
jgi:hypothetical protein